MPFDQHRGTYSAPVLWAMMVLMATCLSCDDDDQIGVIDDEALPFVVRFEEEALRRGLDVDVRAEGISVQIVRIDDGTVAGLCRFLSSRPNRVELDRAIWEDQSDLVREYIVFHELGHCLLDREHTEAERPNGDCVSIMASGTGTCRFAYSDLTREEYLDELFAD